MSDEYLRSDVSPRDWIQDLVARGVSLAEQYPDLDARRVARARFTAIPTLDALGLPQPTSVSVWPSLPSQGLDPSATRRRVVIATPDIVGPVRNGGIGAAYTSLADALAAAGHDVTILYALGRHCEHGLIEEWIEDYRGRGIRLVPLPIIETPAVFHGPKISYSAYKWLARQQFDVAHFPEWGGLAFCAVQAKHLGLGLQRTLLCVGLHSPTIWHDLGNRCVVDSVEQLERDFLERRSVELADVVVSPSQHLLQWTAKWGWRVPERTFVWPYVSPPMVEGRRAPSHQPVRELVFFGRLEARKGLEIFCDAVDHLEEHALDKSIRVTFLGKPGRIGSEDGDEYARRRARRWNRQCQVTTHLQRREALDYLCARAVLAVMPSLADNTPNTVLECLHLGIPFLATAVGGIPEMIAPTDRARVLVEPDAGKLASAIAIKVAHDAQGAAPAFDPAQVRDGWIGWHESVALPLVPSTKPSSMATSVTVCMATRNRPEFLQAALDSIRRQTHSDVDVVLVDDGSDVPEACAAIEKLRAEFRERNWTLLTGPRRYPGAARNRAADHARGKYILFMDDDNLARPDEVAVLLAAAEHSDAEIITCGHDGFTGAQPPADQSQAEYRWLPIGAAIPLGLIVNCIGDTNMLVRRDTFYRAGGFEEESGAGLFEDWTFLMKALVRGVRIEILPDVLYDYRVGPHGFGQSAHPHDSYGRATQPLIELLPPGLGVALLYASGVTRARKSSALSGGPNVSDTAALPARSVRIREYVYRFLVRALKPSPLGTDQGDHLEAQFVASEPIRTFDTNEPSFEPLGQVEAKGTKEGVVLRSLGDEPRLAVVGPIFLRGPLILRMELTTPIATSAQLFWRTPSVPFFNEKHAVTVTLEPGRNIRFIRIPAAVVVGSLRFDPAARACDVLIHTFEVRREPPPS